MNTKNIKKIIVAVALTLAVTFSTGVVDDVFQTSMTSSASACIHQGGSGGGGC